MPIQVAQLAPLFGNLHNCGVYRFICLSGKTLILLFVFAFAKTYNNVLWGTWDNITHYNEVDAQISDISTNPLFALAKLKVVQNITFLMRSNYNKEVSTGYNSLASFSPAFDMTGVSICTSFVIDSQSVIMLPTVSSTPCSQANYKAVISIL